MRKLLFLAVLAAGSPAMAAEVLIYGPSLAPANCGSDEAPVKGIQDQLDDKGDPPLICEDKGFFPLVNEETVAEDEGHNVTVVDEPTWSGMTTNEFAAFDAIVIGDAGCDFSDGEDLEPVNDNRTTWSPAVTGNMTLNTFDVFWHYYALSGSQLADARGLVANGINWAASGDGTGFYYSNGCREFDFDTKGGDFVNLDFMNEFGNFVIFDESEDRILVSIPYHPTMDGLDSVGLSNYSNSVHALFSDFPGGWDVTAIAEFTDGGSPASKGRLTDFPPVVIARGEFPPAPPIPTGALRVGGSHSVAGGWRLVRLPPPQDLIGIV